MDEHDCIYMYGLVGKSIGDDMMEQWRGAIVYTPWRGLNTLQTADILDFLWGEPLK